MKYGEDVDFTDVIPGSFLENSRENFRKRRINLQERRQGTRKDAGYPKSPQRQKTYFEIVGFPLCISRVNY